MGPRVSNVTFLDQRRSVVTLSQGGFMVFPECFLETFWKGAKNLGRALPPSSKHLKGRLDPPVGDVTFLHQRRSVESSFAPKCT